MTITVEFNNGVKTIYKNVSDFYSTGNKYIISLQGRNKVEVIFISDVKHYEKLNQCTT